MKEYLIFYVYPIILLGWGGGGVGGVCVKLAYYLLLICKCTTGFVGIFEACDDH